MECSCFRTKFVRTVTLIYFFGRGAAALREPEAGVARLRERSLRLLRAASCSFGLPGTDSSESGATLRRLGALPHAGTGRATRRRGASGAGNRGAWWYLVQRCAPRQLRGILGESADSAIRDGACHELASWRVGGAWQLHGGFFAHGHEIPSSSDPISFWFRCLMLSAALGEQMGMLTS